jgi:hypothetical protein
LQRIVLNRKLEKIEQEKTEKREQARLEREKKKQEGGGEGDGEGDGDEPADEPKDEPEEEEDEESPTNKIKEKLKLFARVEKMKETNGRYKDKALTKIFKWKLSQRSCENQGWILDGYPKTLVQAKLLMIKRGIFILFLL